jgi:regulator of replication initiation timing
VDGLEAEVEARLRALGEAVPAARAFVSSALRDHERHRLERARLRRRLRLPAAPEERPQPAQPRSLALLRGAQEALVYAHAEGLPALGDAMAVETLAGHMVDLSRQLTVIDLWMEEEANRG